MQDELTTNVILTRGSGGGLYNSALESGAVPGVSPKGTLWAVGTLSNYATLTYGACPLESGGRPPNDVGKTYVVHLTTNDIYLQLTLTNWGGEGGSGDKTFGYNRTTPPVASPSVTITNPAGGAVFAAPANVTIEASASVSGGTVTNVQFFANGSLQGTVTSAPFNVTTGGLAAGAYSLAAVATAAGISATSAVVNVTVATPVPVTLSAASRSSPTGFQFSYAANVGLTYVVQRSTNLLSTNWLALATNTATSDPAGFTDLTATNAPGFYRVGRLPNP